MPTSNEVSIDSVQLSLNEIEEDSFAAASFEFENARTLITNCADQQRKSSLIIKLEADPSHSFYVTDYSAYKDDRWILNKNDNFSTLQIPFNSNVTGGRALKKMLVYHLLPQFHLFGRIRSFSSARTYASSFNYLEEYLLIPNGIDATPNGIRVISVKNINDALDRSKINGSHRQYFLLYFILTFWAALSNQGLIPKDCRLDVPLRLIDTKERQSDIQNEIANGQKGWMPFNEEELSRLVEYSLFWVEKAVPVLVEIKNYIIEHNILSLAHRCVIKSKQHMPFEMLFGKAVDGIVICGYSLTKRKNMVFRNNKYFYYEQYYYRWQRNFRSAIDRVRDGILVFVALITGMRISELCILTFDDVIQSKNGEWCINITRFKTSNDPNYFGSNDLIPIPDFIGDIVKNFKELRNFDSYMRSGFLFEQIGNPKKANILDRAGWRALSKLGDATGVDGVHPHRFRKTIAEILINRSERNIDLIRMLFGHKSYAMTLRYIARNPYLVHSIAETMENHYAEAFVEIVAAVRSGAYSGKAAERIANCAAIRPELFKGKILRLTIFNYIAYMLEAGEPVFIQRTGVGTYCVSCDSYSLDNLPPCVGKAKAIESRILPDPSNCQLDCRNAVVLEEASDGLQRNIAFYSKLLDQTSGSLKKTAEKQLVTKISINEKHLATLNQTKESLDDDKSALVSKA